MAVDMVLLATLLVSIGDILVNITGFCCSGRTTITTKCIKIDHNEDGDKSINDNDIEKISENVERRMSTHN